MSATRRAMQGRTASLSGQVAQTQRADVVEDPFPHGPPRFSSTEAPPTPRSVAASTDILTCVVEGTVQMCFSGPRGVAVSTLDSESSDRGSNPREASLSLLARGSVLLQETCDEVFGTCARHGGW